MKITLASNVFNEALERIIKLYEKGDTVVVSFSGGKDSTIILEMAVIAATMTNRLPVNVVMRDEEIMFPGTFEYCERIAKRPEFNFKWIISGQPIANIFNRACPYFWVFDKTIPREDWVRQPPAFAEWIPEICIDSMVTKQRFPVAEGKQLYTLLGLRAGESLNRKMGILSSGHYVRKHPNLHGVYYARPIYDWSDADVWKAIHDNKWDYNIAYDTMYRLGISKEKLRLAPPTMARAVIVVLKAAYQADPVWFDKVCERLPGVRHAVLFGKHAVEPHKLSTETWQECFERECITDAPKWIADRSTIVAKGMLAAHALHSDLPFPQIKECSRCGMSGSWKKLAHAMYCGDVFSQKQTYVPEVEPEFFRVGAGKWHGKSTF